MSAYTLYVMSNSPYSDKIRMYLRLKRLPFVEVRENMRNRESVLRGATLDDVHLASAEVITRGLIGLGLLEGSFEEAMKEQRYKTYYMHKCSHWLGMDVHDVGAYYQGGKGRPLEPGMVLTVEPGIYVAENASGPAEPYRGIGIRIEDDVLVTESGNEVLTAHIPRTVDAVEHACHG